MKPLSNMNFRSRVVAVSSLLVWQGLVPTAAVGQEMEEIIVEGRLRSSAEQLINERMSEEVVTDLLGAEMIARVGDADVASALRRVSGLSLVGNKFIYVRGLGERYSSATLNGATIPSPDLSRNVIPLDIFPTSIVETLAVQKSYSADKSAAFGGGSVDIRTKSIPTEFTYSFQVGSATNSESRGDMLTYAGGGDDNYGKDDGSRALSGVILSSIQRFSGDLDPQTILAGLQREGQVGASLADATVVNRQLALALNRDISILTKSSRPDIDLKGNIGNNFFLSDDWEVGLMASAGYNAGWRQTRAVARDFVFPGERFETEQESTYAVNMNGTFNTGVRYTDDHLIKTSTLYLLNTEDETANIDYFDENREKSGGLGFREQRQKFEQRTLTVNQISGEHYLGAATQESLKRFVPDNVFNVISDEFQVNWMYSQARANTNIPSEVFVTSSTVTDPETGAVLVSNVDIDSAAVDYLFTELDDDVTSARWEVIWPVLTARSSIEFSAGGEHGQKSRAYRQTQLSLGVLGVADPKTLEGPLTDVFSNENITNPDNQFILDLAGTNNQSYLAATMTDALFGKIDWTLDDKWRVSAGARWEDYRQVALDWNIYAFSASSPQISNDPAVLARGTFRDDQIYPSVSLTYMTQWWAEVFQLRFGWSETVVRPDLREITDASYIDARTGFLTDGNPDVRPADFMNVDMRAEWIFNNSDTVTITLYQKDIDNPIEFFESAASDTNRAREIINAESGRISGLELESLKSLGFLGPVFDAFFVQGNITLQDTELVAGVQADAPTNNVRELSGASDYVGNFMLGFDSMGGGHAATLVYNVFGERLYIAGRNGEPDGYEQPFHSVDMTYSWYPTDLITVKAKLQNLLNETVTIEREGVIIFEEKPGMTAALSVNLTF